MAAKDLITLARAKQDIQAIADASQDALLSTLITAVSDPIKKHCRRDFVSRSYDELYSGNGESRPMLPQYPIISVQSVSYRPVIVLRIQNIDGTTNRQARDIVRSTGLSPCRFICQNTRRCRGRLAAARDPRGYCRLIQTQCPTAAGRAALRR